MFTSLFSGVVYLGAIGPSAPSAQFVCQHLSDGAAGRADLDTLLHLDGNR